MTYEAQSRLVFHRPIISYLDRLHMRRLSSVLVLSTLLAGCLLKRPTLDGPRIPHEVATLTLAGQFSFPPGERFPVELGLPFGGISGLVSNANGSEWLGISDARVGGRIYSFRIEGGGAGAELRVVRTGFIPLEIIPAKIHPDHEGLTRLPDGNLLVASEGTSSEPRLPPSLVEYGPQGQFVRQLAVRDRYIPEPTGPLTRGARGNAGFESLTISPDGERVFTGIETALVQDGDTATFDAGTDARLLEYVQRHHTFEPGREFVYRLEPVVKPSFTPGFYINGLVELLALSRTSLLVLERGYVEEAGNPERSINRIRLFHVTLAGATDVSRFESLKGQTGIVAVTKTLVLDVSDVKGLSTELAPALDNFEGMAIGPRLPDGRSSLILVSDDNFNRIQRTWFLMFAVN
jgi:hypothetical protein